VDEITQPFTQSMPLSTRYSGVLHRNSQFSRRKVASGKPNNRDFEHRTCNIQNYEEARQLW